MTKVVGPIKRKFAPWDDPTLTPFIRFENVTKRFGDFTAVDNLTLDIYEREFFALLGPSGCGKTTLMRMLAGFEQPTEGRILLDGKDLSGIPPYKRPVNMMFQSYALFPHMTVEDNIAFGLRQDRLDSSDINTRVAEMLELVKLEKYAKRKPHQLSGGQKQRVALARSVAKRPKVLLLDEPLGALDKKLREETQFELMDLQVELGMTFLIVTHDQEEAMTVSDRIAVMNHGVIAQIGTASEIYEQPASRYVADFVGEINLIDGTVSAVDGPHTTLACPSVGADIVADRGDGEGSLGSEACFAIRPEKVQITLEPPPPGSGNVLAGEVWDIGYLGDISIYRVRLQNGTIVKATIANRTRIVERPITWEDKVFLTWPRDAGVILTK
jgi:putrescine transport system ATP-binding protein